ncbi:autotransporter outer membrane beta-barrel domain-containing protein [Roseibium sp.]|uniref:autotransporter family protein n=1 Tax=Roseibium sp. TaxID=1936156 RepID=UPI003B5070D9
MTTSAVLNNAIESGGVGNEVTNMGTIATTGAVSFGVFNYGSGFEILNSGVIRTTGFDSVGIFNVASNATIGNTGTIQTREANTPGVLNFGNNTTVSNRGTIWTQGSGATGISSDAANFVTTNTGRIIAERADAIQIGNNAANNIVTLGSAGYLGGTITFDAPTTLNIVTGASHSVLWQVPNANLAGGKANLSGSVPWFYQSTTGQFATFDPTGLTAGFNQFADAANTLARLGRTGLAQAHGRGPVEKPAAVLAFTNGRARAVAGFTALLREEPLPEHRYGLESGRFWITGFGSATSYGGDDTTLKQRIDQAGTAIGYAWEQSADTRLGVMAGYLNGSITADSVWAEAQDIDNHGVFAGIYGDRRFGPVTVGLGVSGGWQQNDSRRFINDNTALSGGLTLGESSASASYDSWFFTSEATLAAEMTIGGTGLVVTPTLRGRYGLMYTGGYREGGSKANATVSAHSLGVLEADVELGVSRDFGLATLSGRAGYLLRGSIGDDDVSVTLVGIPKSVGLGSTGLSSAFLGAALHLNLGPQASFTLDGQGTFSSVIDAFQGMARFAIRL